MVRLVVVPRLMVGLIAIWTIVAEVVAGLDWFS